MATVAAWAQPGALDPTFGTDGFASYRTGFSPVHVATGATLQPDGKVLLVGHARHITLTHHWFGVARIAADGAFDDTFGENGFVTVPFEQSALGTSVALQPDGRIVAAGFTDAGPAGASAFAVVRLLPDGTLDPSFGAEGKVITSFDPGWVAMARDVAIQSDGRIIVAGSVNDQSDGAFALARYLPDGSLDQGFGDGGIVMTYFGPRHAGVRSLAIRPDGRIVVAGYEGSIAPTGNSNHVPGSIAVARYLPDGGLDPTFGDDGQIVLSLDTISSAYDMALQSDGRIVLAGFTRLGDNWRRFMLLRLTDDGKLDSTFGDDGLVAMEFAGHSVARSVAILSDGRMVAGGSGEGAVVVRYLPNGVLDTGFGQGGLRYIDLATYAVLALPDDGVVATGTARTGGVDSLVLGFAAARLLENGDYDPTFADGAPAVALGIGLDNQSAVDVAVQDDGGVVMVGCVTTATGTGYITVRFDASGALDTSFGDGGAVITEFEGFSCARFVAIQSDGRIVVGGSGSGLGLVRYLPNGLIDTSFGDNGLVTLFSGFDARAYRIRPDGRIVVAGRYSSQRAFAQVLPDGSPDTSFGPNGIRTHPGGPPRDIALQTDGRIVALIPVGHSANSKVSDFRLVRLRPNGVLDPSFGVDGSVFVNFEPTDDFQAVGIQPSGRIVVAGRTGLPFHQYLSFTLLGFTPDGALDQSFGEGGAVQPFPAYSAAHSQVILEDGRLLVGANSEHGRLLRFSRDGELDTGFGDPSTTPTGNVMGLAVGPDGRAVGAGGVLTPTGSAMAVSRYLGDEEVGVEPGEASLPLEVSIYPNPSRAGATISFTKPEPGPLRLTVYDTLGRRVAVLMDSALEAGKHELELAPSSLSAGVYYLRLLSSSGTVSQPFTVVR